MNKLEYPVSAIVLAGGQSHRMGRDKALIEFQGKPIIAHVLDTLRELSDDVRIVANHSDRFSLFGARVVPDYDPPCGPLGGIAAGLQASQHDRVVVVACDMPFLNPNLLRYLLILSGDYEAVVPQTSGEFEPLHAVYQRACYHPIVQRLASGQRRVISFFADVRLRVVPEAEWRTIDPDGRSLMNLNTPDDLRAVNVD